MIQGKYKYNIINYISVGKTCLLNRYVKNQYSMIYKATVGGDFLTKTINRPNEIVQLQIWDTAGTERYHAMGAGFYRNTVVCVLVFDLTNPDSFSNVEIWRKTFLEQLQPRNPESYPFVLVGNKSDMKDEIKVEQGSIDNYCKEHNNMPYYSTSAQEGINVEDAFIKVADLAVAQNGNDDEDFIPGSTVNVHISTPPQPKKGCCK